MGSAISQDSYSVLEEDQGQISKSPLKTLPTEFDPRSPSDGIFRTPIQLTATPVRLLDPRSPTVDIERTPIYPLKMDVEEICDKKLDVKNFGANADTTAKVDKIVDKADVPILDLSITESLPDEISVLGFESRQQIPAETTVYADCIESQTLKMSCESQKVKPMLQPSRPRSPLSLIARNTDAQSLRSMVQLKEARKVEFFRCSQNPGDLKNRKSSAVNKENM